MKDYINTEVLEKACFLLYKNNVASEDGPNRVEANLNNMEVFNDDVKNSFTLHSDIILFAKILFVHNSAVEAVHSYTMKQINKVKR